MTTTTRSTYTPTSDEYNGWTNRETWALMLHINNDEGLQDMAFDIAHDSTDIYELSNTLASWVDDLFSPAYWTELGAETIPEGIDMMRSEVGSTWRVNWTEVAESLRDDANEVRN